MSLAPKSLPLFIALFLFGCTSGPSDKTVQPDKMKIDPITASQKCVSLDTAGNYDSAFPYCKASAENDNIYAQTLIGSMYFRGKGTPQSYEQAAYWFQKVAKQGDVNAQAIVGSMYSQGKGVPQNNAQASDWFQKVARQVNLNPMVVVGDMYLSGQWVGQNNEQAAYWYQMAAEQGDSNAQFRLGTMYYGGQIPQDFVQAAYWYQKSAEQGNFNAQAFLGGMYYEGKGVVKDNKQAYAWLSVAATHNEEAIKPRDSVAAQLSPDELIEAQILAAEYIGKYSVK